MTALLIRDLPVVTLEQLRSDLREATDLLAPQPNTRTQRIQRDELIVRLKQDDWHLTDAIRKP